MFERYTEKARVIFFARYEASRWQSVYRDRTPAPCSARIALANRFLRSHAASKASVTDRRPHHHPRKGPTSADCRSVECKRVQPTEPNSRTFEPQAHRHRTPPPRPVAQEKCFAAEILHERAPPPPYARNLARSQSEKVVRPAQGKPARRVQPRSHPGRHG